MILIAKPRSYSKEQLMVEKTNMVNKLSVNNRSSIGRFVEGSSGNPNGRPVGSKNKFTTLKNAFIETFEELGGVDNLVEWAKANQTEFYRMVARLMPREVEARVSTQFTLLDALMEMEENLKGEK
jgi:hypothetical protein